MIQIADLCSNKGVRKYDSSQGWTQVDSSWLKLTQVDSSWLKSTINLSGARGGEGKCIYKSTACSVNQNSEIEPRQRRHGGTSRESRDQRRLARPKCVCNSTTPCSLHEFFNYGALNQHGQSESNLILSCTVQSEKNGTKWGSFLFRLWCLGHQKMTESAGNEILQNSFGETCLLLLPTCNNECLRVRRAVKIPLFIGWIRNCQKGWSSDSGSGSRIITPLTPRWKLEEIWLPYSQRIWSSERRLQSA